MSKKLLALIMVLALVLASFAGCGGTAEPQEERGNAPIEDGVYLAEFNTDSTMFHVNETCDGKGTLTVENGYMTIHILMPSQNIVNLFPGTAEDAQKEGAEWLQPSVETVVYSDGTTEEVNAFDVEVPALDEEFDLALIGTKGKWYDHKVSVSNPVAVGEEENTEETGEKVALADIPAGTYEIGVTMTGGSGKASITSPTTIVVADGKATATIEWSSTHYEYMIVNDVQYDKTNTEGNSTMEIPVVLDEEMPVSALTTAMSEPHLIDYTLYFDSSTLK